MSGVGHAIVQHSAFGYNDDPTFKYGLEVRFVDAKQRALVERLGGKVFESYGEADDYTDTESYPDSRVLTLVPDAPGAFVNEMIDGLRIYIPRD